MASTTAARWNPTRASILFAVGAVAAGLSATIGHLTWDGRSGLYALAYLPMLWWLLPSRRAIAASVFAYYFVSLLPVATSILGFYPAWPAAAGWLLLTVLAAALGLPWVMGWAPYRSTPARRSCGLLLALAVTVFPPLGVMAWVHPLLSAGWIFPGGGWLALAIVTMFWLLVAYRPSASSVATAFVALSAVTMTMHMRYVEPPAPAGIVPIDTRLTPAPSFLAFAKKLSIIDRDLAQSSFPPGALRVLPETTLDEFKASTRGMIETALGRRLGQGPVLAGTTFHDRDETWSGAVLLRNGATPILFRARQPLFFSLWHPWNAEDHYSADWSAPNVFDVGPNRVALRFCSEDFSLFWTLYDFVLDKPTVLVSISNHWWTRNKLVEETQAQHLRAAARLFGVPSVRSHNAATP